MAVKHICPELSPAAPLWDCATIAPSIFLRALRPRSAFLSAGPLFIQAIRAGNSITKAMEFLMRSPAGVSLLLRRGTRQPEQAAGVRARNGRARRLRKAGNLHRERIKRSRIARSRASHFDHVGSDDFIEGIVANRPSLISGRPLETLSTSRRPFPRRTYGLVEMEWWAFAPPSEQQTGARIVSQPPTPEGKNGPVMELNIAPFSPSKSLFTRDA